MLTLFGIMASSEYYLAHADFSVRCHLYVCLKHRQQRTSSGQAHSSLLILPFQSVDTCFNLTI